MIAYPRMIACIDNGLPSRILPLRLDLDIHQRPTIEMGIEEKAYCLCIMHEESLLIMRLSKLRIRRDGECGELTHKLCFHAMIDRRQKSLCISHRIDHTLCHIQWDEDDVVRRCEDCFRTLGIIPDIKLCHRSDIPSDERSSHSDDVLRLTENAWTLRFRTSEISHRTSSEDSELSRVTIEHLDHEIDTIIVMQLDTRWREHRT